MAPTEVKEKTEKSQKKTLCRTPTPGTQGVRIATWKYEAVRRAILRALEGGEILFRDLPGAVKRGLTFEEKENLGSISWYTTTVKLDLEVKGEIERVPGSRPQRLRLAES